MREQQSVLEHQPDPAMARGQVNAGGGIEHGAPGQHDAPRVGPQKPGDQPQDRAFARSQMGRTGPSPDPLAGEGGVELEVALAQPGLKFDAAHRASRLCPARISSSEISSDPNDSTTDTAHSRSTMESPSGVCSRA
jgi:hypothetical protein